MNLFDELNAVLYADKRQAVRNAHVAMCQSKMRFTSKRDARKYCKRIVSKGGDPRVHPYHCKLCQQWHLTRNRDY